MSDSNEETGPFRDDLRSRLVAAGTAAAEQWLDTRANRKMSGVNQRRLAGHVVNALWSEIERAALELARQEVPRFLRPETPSEATARADRAEKERIEVRLQCGRADLRAARLRFVAASMVRTFVEDGRVGDGLKRSTWVPVADVQRWWTVVQETTWAVDALQHFAGSYTISSTHVWELDRSWVQVHHIPCQALVFGADGDDSDELDAAALLKLMIEHHCEAAQ